MRADQFLKQALQVKRDRFLDLGKDKPVSHTSHATSSFRLSLQQFVPGGLHLTRLS